MEKGKGKGKGKDKARNKSQDKRGKGKGDKRRDKSQGRDPKGKGGDGKPSGCFTCGGPHWARDCPDKANKPVEQVGAVQGQLVQTPAEKKGGGGGKGKGNRGGSLTTGERVYPIEEEIRSVEEEVNYFSRHSKVPRVRDTMEL